MFHVILDVNIVSLILQRRSRKRISCLKAIKKLADDADELGYFEFDLQGGELLLSLTNSFQY